MSYKEGRGWGYKFNFFLRRDETNHSTPRCRVSREGKMMAPRGAEGGPCPGSRTPAAPGRAVGGGPQPSGSRPWLRGTQLPGGLGARSSPPASPRRPGLQAHVTRCTRPTPSPRSSRKSERALAAPCTHRGCAALPRAGNTAPSAGQSRGTLQSGALPLGSGRRPWRREPHGKEPLHVK